MKKYPLVAILAVTINCHATTMSFQALGGKYGTDITGDGSTVVGSGDSDINNLEAFRWTQSEGRIGLGELPGGIINSNAKGISGDGVTVVGGSNSINGWEAYRWTQSGGMVGLGDLPGGIFESRASDVSYDGSVIVGTGFSGSDPGISSYEAFRWTQSGGMVGLGALSGGTRVSSANSITSDGMTIVGSSGKEAFLWTESGGMVGLGDLEGGSFRSIAYDISDDGSTVVGTGDSGINIYEAFRWTQSGGMDGIGFLPGEDVSVANGVSDDGTTIVGWSSLDHGAREAFVWENDKGMQSLKTILEYGGIDTTGWELSNAQKVSDDGMTIVGFGYNPSGNFEGFVAVIPEPSVFSLFGFFGGGLWVIRRFFPCLNLHA